MGLVDDHPADSELGQPLQESGTPKPLRREEQQPVFACDCPAQAIDLLRPLHRRVDECRWNASLGEAVDLIFHEGYEWRDNHRQSAIDYRRHPVADALAGPGGRDRENVAPGKHRRDHLCLPRPKGVEAEDLPQHLLCPCDHAGESDGIGDSRPGSLRHR